ARGHSHGRALKRRKRRQKGLPSLRRKAASRVPPHRIYLQPVARLPGPGAAPAIALAGRHDLRFAAPVRIAREAGPVLRTIASAAEIERGQEGELGARISAPRAAVAGLTLQCPRLMGVLNVTPDSFSDGGCHLRPEAAIAHGLALAREGADILDIGGE